MAEPKQSGFEYEGVFYRWHLSDKIKDLGLIDHFAKMPPHEFFAAVEDDFDRSRGPVLAAMLATSIRHAKPQWSPDRVIRYVEDISISDVTFFEGEEEEGEGADDAGLPPEALPTEDVEDTQGSSEKSSEQQDTASET